MNISNNHVRIQKIKSKGNFFIEQDNEQAKGRAIDASKALERVMDELEKDDRVTYFEKYLTFSDMLPRVKINMYTERRGLNANQSCISLGQYLDYLGYQLPIRRKGSTSADPVDRKKLNDSYKVLLVTECLYRFNSQNSITILDKMKRLGINRENYKDIEYVHSEDFKEIEITIAAHGIGIQEDIDFFKFRTNLFMEDRLVMVEVIKKSGKELYIMAIKNKKYFEIMENIDIFIGNK